jgi:hypothetical protein
MKKLLSLLGVISLTASITATLMTNTVGRDKRNADTTVKDITTGFDIKIQDEDK